MEPSIVLSVGQAFHLKQFKDRIIYAGMPNEDVYSIAQRKTDGYRGFGWNLFFPKRKQDIVIDGVKLFVESVTPDEIRFRVE
jgi:hypothetical protein